MKRVLFLLCLFLSVGVTAQVTDGLYAEYLFDDGTANATVGTIDGVEDNVYLCDDRFGCPGRAFEFDPTDPSTISFGDNWDDIMAEPDSSFSISLWFKVNDISPTYRFLLAKAAYTSCGEEERQLFIRRNSNGRMCFTYYSVLAVGSDYRSVEGSTVINDNNWHHIVVNYDGSINTTDGLDRVEMYVDNNLETVTMAGAPGSLGDIPNGTAHFGLGTSLTSSGSACGGTGTQEWDGCLDDLKLFDRELEAFEVDLLYNVSYSCCDPINDSISLEDDVLTVFQLGATYQWIDCSTMTDISGEVNQFFFPSADGSYACVITVDGCSDTTDCIEFHINTNEISESFMGEVKLFPNPTNGNVRIELYHFNGSTSLNISDMSGKSVQEINVLKAVTYLDLSHLRSGIYIMSFYNQEGIKTERLIIN